MREAAIQVLAKWKAPELARVRDARALELAALQRELDSANHTVPWWERTFFGAARDEARIVQLEASVANARAAYSAADTEARAAASAAAAELPPIEIAWRVEQVIASVLAQPSLGKVVSEAESRIQIELDAISERVASLWLSDYSPDHLAHAISHLARSEHTSQSLPELTEHERLGWAPIDIAALCARVSNVLASGTAASARARIQREGVEWASVAETLRQARASLGLDDKLWPGSTAGKDRVVALEQALAKEHSELIAASESMVWEVERALSSFPPLGVYVAATAAAGVLRAGQKSTEWMITAEGGITAAPSSGPRAVILASLLDLRRAVDAAFPGLAALISGRGGRRDAEALARAAKGKAESPYRERQEPDEETHPLHADAAEARLQKAIERSGAREQITRALGHAILLGGIGRESARTSADIGWSEKLAFWAPSTEQTALEQLTQRADWHRETVAWLMNDIACRVDWAARHLPLYRLRNAVLHCQHVIRSLDTLGGNVSSGTVCPVLNRDQALAAITGAAKELGRVWGLSGHKQDLAVRVAHHLTTSPPVASPVTVGAPLRVLTYHEVVISVAEALRQTSFVTHEQRLREASALHAQASAARSAAVQQISFWDELNIFTDSPEEEARDRWGAEMSRLARSIRDDYQWANGLLDQALAIYPPAGIYYELGTLQAHVLAVQAVRRSRSHKHGTTYWCEIENKHPALEALRIWTWNVQTVFGRLPSNGELTEAFIARELTPRDED
jgi:hypothetical protein